MDTLAVAESGHKAPADAPDTQRPQEETKFQKAIQAWRGMCYTWVCDRGLILIYLLTAIGIDLANLVSKLDTTASDIVAHQRDSLVQRKDLAQKTKDFRKLDDASKLSEYKGLLKCTLKNPITLTVWC